MNSLGNDFRPILSIAAFAEPSTHTHTLRNKTVALICDPHRLHRTSHPEAYSLTHSHTRERARVAVLGGKRNLKTHQRCRSTSVFLLRGDGSPASRIQVCCRCARLCAGARYEVNTSDVFPHSPHSHHCGVRVGTRSITALVGSRA